MSIRQNSGRWRLGLALALLTTCLWGILPLALAIALQALDSVTVTGFRFSVTFVLLGSVLTVRGALPPRKQCTVGVTTLLAIATIALGINYLLFLAGLDLTSAGNAEVLIQLAPLLLALGSLVLFKERYNSLQWMGLALLVAGMALFMQDKLQVSERDLNRYIVGSSLVVLAAAAWAVYALAQKQLLQTLSSSQVLWVIYAGCTVLFLPFSTLSHLLTQTPLQWAALWFCSFNTLLAYGAFAESLKHWEASRISAVIALTPILTLVFVDIAARLWPQQVAAEQLTLLGWGGALVVVAGSWLVALGRSG